MVEARGNDDLVLLVRAPDGTIQCDDDSGPGNAPRITVAAQPGEHRVWVGQYSGSSERVAVEVSARLTRVDPTLGPLLGVRELGAPGSEVLVEGTSSGELGPSALGARCDGGLIPARPHVVVHTSTAVDVVLSTVGAGTGRPPFLLIRDPDGALRCVTDPLGRQAWAAGDHAIYVGVRDEDEAGRFSLRLRSEVSSLDTW